MNLSDLWIVEWSQQQRAFHVSSADDMLRENLECYYHDRDPDDSDWMVVGIVDTYELAQDTVRRLKASWDVPPSSSR